MSKDKIIFLDMDGVLVTDRSHAAYGSKLLMRHIDPVGARLIQRLCDETGAKIVISSAWRRPFNLAAMYAILQNGGFADCPLHHNWCTPDLKGVKRGLEIEAWRNANGNPHSCIIDDQADMLESQEQYFVHTDTRNGFLWEHYERARDILTKAHKLHCGVSADEN